MYILVVERLADGILGVRHGVAAFDIQFRYNAATCCYLVDIVYLVYDNDFDSVFGCLGEEFANYVTLEIV